VGEEAPERLESKRFFLRDVFMSGIFPAQDLAARTEAEIRRVRLQRVLAAAAALVIALLILIPSIISFTKNRARVAETGRVSNEAKDIDWPGPMPPADKVDKLDKLRQHTEL